MSTIVISLPQFTQSKIKFTDNQAPTIKYCNTEIQHLKKNNSVGTANVARKIID